jgi:tetratricopeptide (TPR) repeat protein
LAILEPLYTPNHSNVVIGLTNLASLFYQTGRFDEAIDTLERAIVTNRRVNGPGHVLEATARGRLAHLFRARGDTKAGLAEIQSALEIWRQSQGVTHFRYAMCLQNYGELQMDAGNMQLAVPALRDALEILRRTRSAHNYDLATALVSYGVSLARTGMPLEAEVKIREALSNYEIALPRGHALIASARSALAESLLAQGRIPEAESLLIDSDKQLEGKVHFNRRLSLQRLIRLYEAKGDRQVLERFRSELAAFERRVRAR